MYQKYGFYKETLISLTKKGKKGAEEIVQMMADFRNTPPKSFAGSDVVRLVDYQAGISKDLLTGAETPLDYDLDRLESVFKRLEAEAMAWFDRERAPADTREIARSASLCLRQANTKQPVTSWTK